MALEGKRFKNFAWRYGISVGIFVIALVLTKILWPAIQPSPVPLFFAAILAAFWGGFGPGLFISVVSALTIDFFFLPPYDSFEWSIPNVIRIGVFITVSSLVSWLNTTRKKLIDERSKLLIKIEGFNEELQAEVEKATQQLTETNDALLKTQQHLARSERLGVIGQMAASLAHEVGTPLNAISGHLELLSASRFNDGDGRRRIRIIRQQLDSIVGTVRRLLEWTHNRNASFEPINLEKLIKEILSLVGPTLEKHSIVADLITECRLPLIESNREGLQQVFLNLINNSIDAMPSGGRITVTTRLTMSGEAQIDFQDTGEGIDRQHMEYLFEPMWTTKASGGGFGLAIARETLAEHSGDIQVIEDQQIGAGFRLTLPIKQMSSTAIVEEVMSHVA